MTFVIRPSYQTPNPIRGLSWLSDGAWAAIEPYLPRRADARD